MKLSFRSNPPSLLWLSLAAVPWTDFSRTATSNGGGSGVLVQAQLNNVATMANDDRLTKFVQLLDRSGISPSIASTVLAPSNVAWDAWQDREDDSKLWDKYTTQPEFFVHLRELLLWHLVTEGAFTTEQIFDNSREFLENTMGNITIDQRFQKVDNVALDSFNTPNIATGDGVLHVLDEVIVPPYMAVNMIEHLLERDLSVKFSYSAMANLALFAGLDEQINELYENGLTLLVPPDRRFNRAQLVVSDMLQPESKAFTRDFVLAHLIKDIYHYAGVQAMQQELGEEQMLVTSELGTHMWITTTGERLRFQSRELLLTDQVARNGIFHVLDLPFFPPFVSDFAEFTAISTTHDTSDCYRFFRQALLSSADISKTYNTTLTLFCPTRGAFDKFNNEDFNRLNEPVWVRHGTEFLMNHISSPALTRAELVNRAPSMITMLNGAEYELKRSGDRPRIKNTEFEQGRSDFGDLIALDGYMHLLDTAISPTAVTQSIYDQSNLNPDFSLLVENIDFVQLTDLVDRDLPLTMLAPDNTAFRRISFPTLGGADIVRRHIFKGLLFCDVIANQTQIKTVNEENGEEWIPVELRGEPGSGVWGYNGGQNIFVGGGFVHTCDIFARNGVLHYIDRVLGMDYDTVSPTVSPAPTITAQPTVVVPPTAAPVAIPTGFAPIQLPPIVPGLNPWAKTDAIEETPAPDSAAPSAKTANTSVGVLLLSSLLVAACSAWGLY